MKFIRVNVILILGMILISCSGSGTQAVKVEQETFGEMPNGDSVEAYIATNSNGMEMKVITYGGSLVSLKVPDSKGNIDDVILGYKNLEDYVNYNQYFGAIIGRYANRIDEGKFTLDGKEYELNINDGNNHLHGGEKGFDKVLWQGQKIKTEAGKGVKLTYTSEDGEQGYPGKLKVSVSYILTENNELKINYEAQTNKPTIVNLTNHSYFNLAGAGNSSILDHKLKIKADKFTPIDSTLIPTGEMREVAGTPFDFRNLTKIGARIDNDNKQLKYGEGYDHNFVLNREDKGLEKVAKLVEDSTGRIMEVYTTEPGLQFYSGNFLDGTIKGKSGIAYQYRSALCLETQHFPDSPNHPDFPDTVLRPGEEYKSKTVYKFSTQ